MEGITMLRWAPTFLIVALIAVLLALLETLTVATGTEKILFVFFLALFLSPLCLNVLFANLNEKGDHEHPEDERLLFPSGK
jgi:uncharacterized membrane protein YtjA (UPF0391 family)